MCSFDAHDSLVGRAEPGPAHVRLHHQLLPGAPLPVLRPLGLQRRLPDLHQQELRHRPGRFRGL